MTNTRTDKMIAMELYDAEAHLTKAKEMMRIDYNYPAAENIDVLIEYIEAFRAAHNIYDMES